MHQLEILVGRPDGARKQRTGNRRLSTHSIFSTIKNRKPNRVQVEENMKTYFSRYPNRKVVDICKEYDNAYQQELGKSLYDIRLMCAARLITFDIRYPFHILTAKDITFRSMSLSERRTYVAS